MADPHIPTPTRIPSISILWREWRNKISWPGHRTFLSFTCQIFFSTNLISSWWSRTIIFANIHTPQLSTWLSESKDKVANHEIRFESVLITGQRFSKVEPLLHSIDNPSLQSSINQKRHLGILMTSFIPILVTGQQQPISYTALCAFLSLRGQRPARNNLQEKNSERGKSDSQCNICSI